MLLNLTCVFFLFFLPQYIIGQVNLQMHINLVGRSMLDQFPLFFTDVQIEGKAFTGSKYNHSDSPINSNK